MVRVVWIRAIKKFRLGRESNFVGKPPSLSPLFNLCAKLVRFFSRPSFVKGSLGLTPDAMSKTWAQSDSRRLAKFSYFYEATASSRIADCICRDRDKPQLRLFL